MIPELQYFKEKFSFENVTFSEYVGAGNDFEICENLMMK